MERNYLSQHYIIRTFMIAFYSVWSTTADEITLAVG
jgi:hypothetical protein